MEATNATVPTEESSPRPNLPWVRCKLCRRTVALPSEWRELRVSLAEAAGIVLKVHQKRCALN